MGLETGTFVDDLTPTWPTGSDKKNQGDDHLRLIKSVLKGTFPRAGKAFYFPTLEATAITISLDRTDMNNIIEVDTSGGDVIVNLPSTLTTDDKGWRCEVIKTSNDANGAMVTPAAGTILSKVGSTATIRVGILCEPATFVWSGTAWRCFKPGPMIGSTEEFDGASLPPGYLWPDGQTFTAVTFAELNLVLAGNTKRDKRGRISVGRDNMGVGAAGRVGAVLNGTAVGNTAGLETTTLLAGNHASHSHGATQASHTHASTNTTIYAGQSIGLLQVGAVQAPTSIIDIAGVNTGASSNDTVSTIVQGTADPFSNMPPSIIANKIIRAC